MADKKFQKIFPNKIHKQRKLEKKTLKSIRITRS